MLKLYPVPVSRCEHLLRPSPADPGPDRAFKNALRLLHERGAQTASHVLADHEFSVRLASSDDDGDHTVLFATLSLPAYEHLRTLSETHSGQLAFEDIVAALGEVGPQVNAILVELADEAEDPLADSPPRAALTQGEIKILVTDWIGVEGGYLGDFNPRTHREFYTALGLSIDPEDIGGTLRERFIDILKASDPAIQARILRGILERYELGSAAGRTDGLLRTIQGWISRLEAAAWVSSTHEASSPRIPTTSSTAEPHRPPHLDGLTAAPGLFISHASSDHALVAALLRCLESCLEVPQGAIRCTPIPDAPSKPGDVSDEALRENIEQCAMMLVVVTRESLSSDDVILQLGAAWALRKPACILLAPGIAFNRLPGPLSRLHATRSESNDDLATLITTVAAQLQLRARTPGRFTAAISTFVSAVKAPPPDDSSG
ncbi:toll/interleukin-1 receptor domain-containing protein [Chondromyces apiculatus]|uniref:TIR domain-containing protein n=1 Tax=Chondromyces apiculatus DSM 436 TaxID=1192034 RepID=A0A017STP6_9BACT|nr:toll/interleukin-1 receptor domain-containing protein [Chondromyces apiculatus]EYF00127.1 Hypothetical protein CAP_1349 [Chondromyces apiculatus DSM 436]